MAAAPGKRQTQRVRKLQQSQAHRYERIRNLLADARGAPSYSLVGQESPTPSRAGGINYSPTM